MKQRIFLAICTLLACASSVFASGYGVFTQGASGLGQANAVVAHPTGPSSLYFNPALINDVSGQQVEIGTTLISSTRDITYDALSGGGSEKGDTAYNFPTNFYYTHQNNENLSAGLGVFFPFGLSNEWDQDYEGRYIGTSGEMVSMNINPVISYRINENISLAAGLDLVYVQTELKAMINQTATYGILDSMIGPLPPPATTIGDVEQVYKGNGWGTGYNLGALVKVTDGLSIGAAYRSKVNVDLDGGISYTGEDPTLWYAFPDGGAETTIKLPAQFVAGVAADLTDKIIVETGIRWEDWDVNDVQTLALQYPFMNQTEIVIQRDWHSTMAYNIGVNYQINDTVALNLGYLYGENAVPDSTLEPIIPDSDAHLITLGTDLTYQAWTLSAALGYEHHDSRRKDNLVSDPLGSTVATMMNNGTPTFSGTANGVYDTEIYLFGISLGYRF